MKKILIIGPSGSGKTYVSAYLRKQEINAPDADLIEGLANWFDGVGNIVKYPVDAGPEFFDNHQFRWDREFLKNYLEKTTSDTYLFGLAGNIFEMTDLFDKTYFLKAPPELLAERLRHESRENPMGQTDYQVQNALEYAKEKEEQAVAMRIPMIDATQTPEEIFAEISK